MTLIGTAACGGDSGSGGGDGSSNHGFSSEYVPPRYEWSPGTPGRAVGIHAVATIGGEEKRSDELEIELLEAVDDGDPAAGSSALTSAGGVRAASAALCSTELGEAPEAFETINQKICWTTFGVSGGALGGGGSFASYLIFTREGTYAAPFASMDVYIPPDLVNISDIVSVGCLLSEEGQLPVSYLNGMKALSISTSFVRALTLGAPLSPRVGNGVGLSVFLDASNHFARALQYDTNLATVSIGLIPFPVELRLQTMSGFRRDPWLYRKSDNICLADRNPFETEEASSPTALTFAAPSSDPNEQLREAADELLAPLMRHLASEEGFGPAPHMMAGSNADAFASFGGPGLGGAQAGSAPPSTFDDLLASIADEVPDAENDQEIASIMARQAQDLGNILPSPVLLDTLLRNAAAGIELANDATFAGGDYRGRGLIRIEGAVGEPVVLDFEARELAELLGVDEAAVLGATLHLSATHTLSASEHVLEDTTLSLSFTPERSIPLVVKVRVDLSTAAGPFDAALDGIEPRLTPRLIVLEAGAPEHLALSAAGRVTAGGAITLNAVITDAAGNPSTEPVSVELFDGDGRSLGTATSEHGVATLQYVPTASSPVIDRVEHTELTRDDETLPGIEVFGSGFSVDAEIRIDGEPISELGVAYNVRSSSSILIALDAEPGTAVEVTNPGGATSGEAVVEH